METFTSTRSTDSSAASGLSNDPASYGNIALSDLEKFSSIRDHLAGSGVDFSSLLRWVESMKQTISEWPSEWSEMRGDTALSDFYTAVRQNFSADNGSSADTERVLDAITAIDSITGQPTQTTATTTSTPSHSTVASWSRRASNLSTIAEAVSIATDELTDFRGSADFYDDMTTAFGEGITRTAALDAINSIIEDTADISFEVADIDQYGADAAYAAATSTIYLSEDFLRQNENNLDNIANVIIEEWGHHVDEVLNSADTAGDEGEVFMSLVKDFNFDLADLRAENDQATFEVNGQSVLVEQAFGTVSLPTTWVIFRSDRGSILAFKRDATVSALTDVYFRDASSQQGRVFENLQSPLNIFGGQFSVTTRVNNLTPRIRPDGTIGFRSGFIQPRLRMNAPQWTRIR
ncbi:hypothetical protein S7335_960 [Synechococcus sp. PCC 7335]|uniref:hypothetical protein n=1 Tax=Synechococcus sp. (strain ATCC 29403 / PCC 7335) TaxID=91464 RepID=UPI00017ED2CA|nr:hypothetical protein [Synechococcus sp. PCC 7335]EDX82659.1 hypothetical protein S7335_960 [Synechococcus sp. PCC 7335]